MTSKTIEGMKLLLTIIMLAFAGSMNAQKYKSNTDVNNEWRSKTIAVKNGGQTPDVMTLLKAYHKALPTWVVGEVLKQNARPAKGTRYDGSAMIWEDDGEGDFRILIDSKNGYADLSSQTDIDQMSCGVWRKKNGHRIFAISLYEQHDPVQHLLCWYDYDPQTQTMKAAESPLDSYRKPYESVETGWDLPMHGTDFIIREYAPLLPTIQQVYQWDGESFHHAKTQICDFSYKYFGEDEAVHASTQGYAEYALVDIDDSGKPSLCLRQSKDANYFIVLSEFKGEMNMVTLSDEAHMLERISHVVPEAGKPWTTKDVVVVTTDNEHVRYYAVLQDGMIGYYVIGEPVENEEGRVIDYNLRKLGYGAKDESIDIVHAKKGEFITLDPQWKPCEFIEEEP